MQQTGTVIDNKYEILTQLDEGGMSRVYLARDKRLNKQWAIKEIKQSGKRETDEIIAKSFVTEANMIKRLDHPMIPRIVDIINQKDAIFVVMDYIEGQSFEKVIKQHGPQPQDSVVEWGLQLTDALDYLHTRTPPIIFRDMKPGNVMLKPDGSIAIIDFGIAREYRDDKGKEEAGDTTMLGTRGYAAPEQFGGYGQTDGRTDVYCLGATLYHLLTGNSPAEPPYEILPIRQVDPTLSPGLERVIAKCTQQNPEERYVSAAELYYALDNYEKSDLGYFKKLKRKLGVCIACLAVSFLLVFAGLCFVIAHDVVLSGNYDYKLALAHAATKPDVTASYLLEAIELVPSDSRAYLELIALYKHDNQFSLIEEEQFNHIVLKHLASIKDDTPHYAALAFEIGKLYWYYYTYGQEAGDNQLTRISHAAPWFSAASNIEGFGRQLEAQLYSDIAVFEMEISAKVSEGTDEGLYRPFYEVLISLNDLAVAEDNSVVKLRVASLTFKALESHPRKFRAEGIYQADLLKLFNHSVSLLDEVHPTSKTLDAIKMELEKRKEHVEQSLEDAYKG